jgi:hypothetical protein
LCSVKKSKQFWPSCQSFWQLEIKKCNFQNFSNLKKLCYWGCQSAKIRSDNCKKSFQSFENLYVSLSIIIIFKKFPFCLQTASSSLHSADPSLLISTAANSLQMQNPRLRMRLQFLPPPESHRIRFLWRRRARSVMQGDLGLCLFC